ncbi:uncharacterized protein LOC132649087 [Meriones unguiculatus]|uniref:uncharacterized protein LOC132649087 n=1 Tax=Meriones unguiculatus TaxID=10047 RepID=UPI00293F5AE4|nr:uncharacterized protein LOC132649087 [Meriones unguiculatus]
MTGGEAPTCSALGSGERNWRRMAPASSPSLRRSAVLTQLGQSLGLRGSGWEPLSRAPGGRLAPGAHAVAAEARSPALAASPSNPSPRPRSARVANCWVSRREAQIPRRPAGAPARAARLRGAHPFVLLLLSGAGRNEPQVSDPDRSHRKPRTSTITSATITSSSSSSTSPPAQDQAGGPLRRPERFLTFPKKKNQSIKACFSETPPHSRRPTLRNCPPR